MKTKRRVHLHERDLELLEALQEGRFFTTTLIAAEFYSHRNAANRRLKELLEAGFISRQQGSVTQDAIWYPTRRAVQVLIEAGRLTEADASWTWKQSQADFAHKQHEADVNRLRLAFRRTAGERGNVVVEQCLSGPRLFDRVHDRDGTAYPVRPDRFLQLSVADNLFYYFIEVDRGTRSLSRREGPDVCRQLYAYSLYHEHGGFAQRYGGPDAIREEWPFRVLITAPSEQRRNNIIAAMITAMSTRGRPGSTMRAYAVFDDVIREPFGDVWITEGSLAPILRWVDARPVDVPVGASLADERYADLREVLGAAWLRLPYKRGCTPGREATDPKVRDRFIRALIETRRIRGCSVLESSWKSAAMPVEKGG